MQRSQIIITAIGVLRSMHSTFAWQASPLPDTLIDTPVIFYPEEVSNDIDKFNTSFTTSRMKEGIKKQAMMSFTDFEATIHSSNNGSLNFYIVSLDLDKYRNRK